MAHISIPICKEKPNAEADQNSDKQNDKFFNRTLPSIINMTSFVINSFWFHRILVSCKTSEITILYDVSHSHNQNQQKLHFCASPG